MLSLSRPLRRAALGRSLTCTRHCNTRNPLVEILLRNPELDAEDARSELRWMRQAITLSASGTSSSSSSSVDAQLRDMVTRRAEGEPLQYILGDVDFGPLTLLTRAPTLIPRPETAYIVENLAARILRTQEERGVQLPKLNVLDLCTGSGCIPLLLSHLLGDTMGTAFGVDISPQAVSLALDNIKHVGEDVIRVKVFQADILATDFVDRLQEETGGIPIHLITSNPPYIPAAEYATLPRSVRAYEDQGALLAGGEAGEGVAFYEHIARLAPRVLAPAPELEGLVPRIAVEIGAKQGDLVYRILPGRSEVVADQYGRDRMVLSVL